MPRRSHQSSGGMSLDNLFNHTPHGPKTLLRSLGVVHRPSDTFQYFIIEIKAKFTSSVRKNVVKLSLRGVEEEAGGSCRKSDFILKTLSWTFSGEYFVRESLFYGSARAINQLALLHAAKTKNYGQRETKPGDDDGQIEASGEKCKFLDHQEISTSVPQRRDFMWFCPKICRLMCW